MRLLLAPVVNLFKLLWALLFLPLRALGAGKGPQWVRFRLSGELPFRRAPSRDLSRFWRRPDPAAVLSIESLRRQLRRLAGDPKLRGVVFEVDGLTVSPAAREALLRLFDSLRAAGKEVVGCGVTVSNAEYELLCRTDRIILPAAGRVDLVGFSAELSAIGGALDQFGVKAHFLRRGDYKTAPELFTRQDISEIQRRTVEGLLDERYEALVRAVSIGRKLSPDEVRARIDEGPYSARRALSAGLVDVLGSEAELPWLLARPDDPQREGKPEAKVGTFGAWAASRVWPQIAWRRIRRRPAVGVVSINGMIAEGKGGTAPAGPVVAGSVSVISALQAAGKDPRVPAVVLYVNSPGGSAPASEMILDAVKRLSEKKPVVAYFDRVAASGGYMALCGAQEVWGGPGALVGSIGVFAGKFELSGLFARLGVHRELITRGRNAGFTSPSRGFTDDERRSMEREIEETYQSFLEIVASARGRPKEEIHPRGEGRVFSSERAMQEGLIDHVGSFEDALRRALELASARGEGKSKVPRPDEDLDVALFGTRPPRSGLLGLLRRLQGVHLLALDDGLLGLSRTLLLLVLAFAAGCHPFAAKPPSPERTAREYAAALREGRLDDAHRHAEGLDADAFRARYADDEARVVRAEQLERAFHPNAEQQLRAGEVRMERDGQGQWRIRETPPPPDAVQSLGAFLEASADGDFTRAWSLLSAPLRARYTPERLAEDFARAPLAKERLDRARAALQAGSTRVVVEGDEAWLPLGEGRAVRLVREAEGWRVSALE